MVEASQFSSRLQVFAESFTGYPVRIVTSQSREQEKAQTKDFLRIEIPSRIEHIFVEEEMSKEKQEEIDFKIYKGLVALQASAALYRGIPSSDLMGYRGSDGMNKLIYELDEAKKSKNEAKIDKLRSLLPKVEIMNIDLDNNLLLSSCLSTIELSRRMQSIKADYPFLGEDMQQGFTHLFNPIMLKKAIVREDKKTYITNEIDLAMSRAYWINMGIDKESLESVIKGVPRDYYLGDNRELLSENMERLSQFDLPFASSYDDSLSRTIQFKEFVEAVMKSKKLGSPFTSISRAELNEREKIKNEERGYKKEVRLDTRAKLADEMIFNSFVGGLTAVDYAKANCSSIAFCHIFQDMSIKGVVEIDIPESFEKGITGKNFYLPEMREGIFVPRAVRVILYDLVRSQPINEEQFKRKKKLEASIEELKKEAGKHNSRIRSNVNYIYDLQKEVRARDSAERQIKSAKKQLDVSKEVYEKIARRGLGIDGKIIRLIENEMEKIKPAARSIVRGCFEGEIDEKKYYDWWLETQAGGYPMPNFYYQWQKRRRDVASILVLDASHSVERIAQGNRTVLDIMKEAAYYFSIAAQSLEDKVAVIAYNGKGALNSRVFLLKDFMENTETLKNRMELLKGELNNRDGSAIRYANQYLLSYPAKTKYLFHLGDMQPSDSGDWVTKSTFSYEGTYALEDVANAFRSAKTYNIVPYGICIMQNLIEKNEEMPPLSKGKLNPRVLAKIREQKSKSIYAISDEMLQKNFQRNYKIIKDIETLPQVLRNAYMQLSFR